MLKSLLLLLCLAYVASAQVSLLQNGCFENKLEGWLVWGTLPEALSLTEDAVVGPYGVELKGNAELVQTGLSQRLNTLQAGGSYRLTFQAKTSHDVHLLAGLLERGERAAVIQSNYQGVSLKGTGKWTRYTVDFTLSGKPFTFAQLVLRCNRLPDGQNVRFDAFELAVFDKNTLLDRSRSQVEAQALLQQMQATSAAYKRLSPRTALFSRAQLKYGLQRDDYLHKWLDRPLLVDPSLQIVEEPPADGGYQIWGLPRQSRFINPNAYKVMQQTAKMSGLDGFAFFPETGGRKELYQHCLTPGYEMTVLTELIYDGRPTSMIAASDDKMQSIELALNNPNSFRLDGKVVFLSYPNSDDWEYWRGLKKLMRERFGDTFLLMPAFSFFPDRFKRTGENDAYSQQDLELLRDRVRQWLRVVDGYYHNAPAISRRRYYPELDREIIIPIVHSVLAEPEFQNKYIGWGTKVGHENYELLGYSLDCEATAMLRGTMETARLAKADFINGVEWDEQNENTSFRPTLYNSYSTTRILRHFAGAYANEPLPNLPGDDLNIPNLVLSYRKLLAAGQVLEMELLNIPDHPVVNSAYAVTLRLRDLAGKLAHEFSPVTLPGGALDAVFCKIGTEELVSHQVLVPELEIRAGERSWVYRDFQPIELRASWNTDYKWVKQPLRDLLQVRQASLRLLPEKVDGRLVLEGELQADEELRSLEVVESGDVIYSHADGFAWRESEEHVVLSLNWQSWVAPEQLLLNGSVTLSGADLVAIQAPLPQLKAEGNGVAFKQIRSDHLCRHLLLACRRQDAAAAKIRLDFPGVVTTEVAVADLLRHGAIGFPGPQGLNLVLQPYCSQLKIPQPLRASGGRFRILVNPASSTSVLHLQAVSASGKVYRGQTLSLYRPVGTTGTLGVYAVAQGKGVSLTVDRGLLTDVAYAFNPHSGTVLKTSAGRMLQGMLAGHVPQVTLRGAGETRYGNALWSGGKEGDNTVPQWVPEAEGTWSLDFRRSYVSLPQALVPPFAGYELSLAVYPRSQAGTQALLGCDFTGFMLVLQDGIPEISIYRDNLYESGLPCVTTLKGDTALNLNAWNNLQVVFDQKELRLRVNDKEYTLTDVSGYQRYPRIIGLGVDSKRGNFFDGKISRLQVKHYHD